MAVVAVTNSQLTFNLFNCYVTLRQASLSRQIVCRILHRLSSSRWFNLISASTTNHRYSLDNFKSKCSITNIDVIGLSHVAVEDDDISVVDISCCSTTLILQLNSDVLETESFSLLTADTYVDSVLTTLPVLTEEEHKVLATTTAHPEVKTMGALQYFPAIEDSNTRRALFEVETFA